MQNATADAFQLPHKVNKDSRWFGVLGETFSEIFFGDSLQRLFKPCYVFKCSESADINNNNNNNNWEFQKYSKDKLSDNFVILCSTKISCFWLIIQTDLVMVIGLKWFSTYLSAITREHSCFHRPMRTFSLLMTVQIVLIMPCQILDKSLKLKM